TTERACAALGLEPWHDPTNIPGPGVPGGVGGGVPLRSAVRADVVPVLEAVLGPGVAAALVRTADLLREDDDVLSALAEEALASAWREPDDPPASAPSGPEGPGAGEHDPEPRPAPELDAAALAPLAPAVRRRALRAALVAWGAPSGAVSSAHVDAVDRLVTNWHGQGGAALPGGGVVLRRCGRLTWVAPPQADDRVPGRTAGRVREDGSGCGGSGGHG
ncbi:TilS substrate-binding domain-containing protein, partial [Actinotalea ferrariae]|uniref:TilS substrate-binding domain-containing protein n=1 Tax=Actinotalea ferrariae TaxID=1386098 RepID=UPI001C8BE5AA